jgi:hypothetical protein
MVSMVRPRGALAWIALALPLLPFATIGCEDGEANRHGRTAGSTGATESASRVPSDVFFYGHVFFGGDDAYLVEGRWYRPAAEGWRVFTEEPLELELLRRTLDDESSPLAP